VATYVYACSQGQRTHSARTNFLHWQMLIIRPNLELIQQQLQDVMGVLIKEF
jgi:hypothetical protein